MLFSRLISLLGEINLGGMKVAIVHYWFISRRGGEKVVESLLKIFPKADIYTLFYDQETYGDYIKHHNIYTSILNKKYLRKHYQKLFPLYPIGIRSLHLKKKYDLIISSESGPAKGIVINNDTPHISYIHTPMRYCWSHRNEYLNSVKSIYRPLMNFFLNRLKRWDITTVDNVDLYLANSENVARRIKKYYHKNAIVVYPPIANELFTKPLVEKKRDIFLSFGAITPYKKIDLLVEVFNKNGKNLVIIGDGSEKEKLEKKAKANIKFKGMLTWIDVENYLSRTKALIFPGEEDLGMVPLEVMAYGIPVIAFGKGGALETVVENRSDCTTSTGIFFNKQTVDSVQNSIDFFENIKGDFNPLYIRNHARKFSEDMFIANIHRQVEKIIDINEN